MKKSALVTFLLCFIGIGVASAQIQSPGSVPIDSSVIVEMAPVSPEFEPIAQIPTVDFPSGAKILVWWPKMDYDYNMPNLLKHEQAVEPTILNRSNSNDRKQENSE